MTLRHRPKFDILKGMECILEFCDRPQYGNQKVCVTHHVQITRYGIEPRPIGANHVRDKKCDAPWCSRLVSHARLCIPCNKRRRRYSLTYDEYIALEQVCAGCGTDEELFIDHNHSTGHFRGMLCRGCNTALGQANDSPERLRKLADYLEKNGY